MTNINFILQNIEGALNAASNLSLHERDAYANCVEELLKAKRIALQIVDTKCNECGHTEANHGIHDGEHFCSAENDHCNCGNNWGR